MSDNPQFNAPDNPFSGIEETLAEVLIDKIVSYTCLKIATCRDLSDLSEVYGYLSRLPIKAVLQFPKPLLDEFWKFCHVLTVEEPTSNAAAGAKALVNGLTAMLNAEDEFQAEFHGISREDLLADYADHLLDIASMLKSENEVPADWAKPVFRKRSATKKGEL